MLTRRSLLRSLPTVAGLPHGLLADTVPSHRLLIGTGTGRNSGSKGIYFADFSSDGTIGTISLAAELNSPTFLASGRGGKALYAISEVGDGRVTAFSIEGGRRRALRLDRLNQQTAEGDGPAHISVNVDGRSAFVSNYGGGSLTSYQIQSSGALSAPVSHFNFIPVDERAEHKQPHAHEATPSPDGRWLLVNDLGSDRIWLYRIDPSTGRLTLLKIHSGGDGSTPARGI